MNTKSNEYLESLFKGVDIIIDKKLEKISYDTTIICTITDSSNSKNGIYKATDGSINYTVYSDSSKYLTGDQVRVNIPMGDYSQKKFIIGKYVGDNDSAPITFVSPADSIVNISGNLTESIRGGIVANGIDTERVLWNKLLDSSFIAMQNNDIYNTIVLKADFRTLLSNYEISVGNYGLRLDFLVCPSSNSSVKIKRSIELDSSEMFGNPYSFSINSPQVKVIKINTIGIVEGIELTLYQKGNFKDRNGNPITSFVQYDNIFVDNIVLGLGCNLGNNEDNKLQIYSENDPSYKYSMHNTTTNLKTMGLLWLNKDDNNRYIGFSDGIYDPSYDEFDYIEKSKEDTRLIAQKGKEIPPDKTSLTLAANIEEAAPAIKKAVKVVTQDLVQLLREFQLAVSSITKYRDNLDELLNGSKDKYLIKNTNNIEAYLDNEDDLGLIQQYEKILNYGYQIWNNQSVVWNNDWNFEFGAKILTEFNIIQGNIQWLLSKEGFPYITSTYSGFKSIYDTYSIRINRLMDLMWGYLGLGENPKAFPSGVFNEDYATLMSYKDKKEFIIYKSPDLLEYDNKYCIYWFRYEKDYIAEESKNLVGDGWKLLSKNEILAEPHSTLGDTDGINVGLPTVYYFDDDSDFEFKYRKTKLYNKNRKYYEKNNNDYILISNPSRSDVEEEKYYARVCVNSEGKFIHAPKALNGNSLIQRYMQNDLEQEKYLAVLFYNHNMYKSNELTFINSEVVPNKTTLDKGDILIFEHLKNSTDSYQSYSITNYLMDGSDEIRSRQIRCHYDGLLAKDNAFVNGFIYWYVPNQSTMISVDISDLRNKGFVIDETRSEFYENNNEKIYTTYCFYKQINAKKKNDVAEDAKEWDKWDYTNGTDIDNRDFWYLIKPYYEQSSQNNFIKCVFIKENESDEVSGIQLFNFGVKGTSGTKYTLAITKPSEQKAAMASKGLNLKAQLKDFNNTPIPFVDNLNNFRVEWDCYKTIQGEEPKTLTVENLATQNLEANFNTQAGVYGILRASGNILLQGIDIEEEPDTEGRTRKVDLDVLYSVPYSAGEYYLQGPTEIIYNSLGTLDSNTMFNTPYVLYAKTDIDENIKKDNPISDIQLSLVYYKKAGIGNSLKDKEWTQLDPEKDPSSYNFYKTYMPKLNNNNLVPAPIYLDNLDCYAVLVIEKNGTILWRQPIIILQNRYASSMLNDWDGSLTIDEKNGTILSSMVGAGRKSSNNTFEGVLMGNVALGTESNIGFEDGNNIGVSNQTGLGIYGFHDGAQSFGFNINGTAFLGKTGKGRIIFNGNQGVIASSNWFLSGGKLGETQIETLGKDGMCIDLENGHIDAYNFKLTSGGIYLNSNPEKSDKDYYFKIGNENNYIYFSGNNELKININHFILNAWKDNSGLYLNSNPSKGSYYFRVGKADENELQFKVDGTFKIIANRFILNAWKNGAGLYLNSDPGDNKYYFKVGNNNNYINFSVENGLEIKSTNFELDAWTDSGAGLYLNSSPNENEYYFRVGNNNNYINFATNNELEIKSANFELNALANDIGLYLNSNPSNEESYFRVGNSSNYINFTAKNGLEIKSTNFILNAWKNSAGLYLNSNPGNNESYFRVGNANGALRYYLDKNGVSVFTISAKNDNGQIIINSAATSNPLEVGDNFSVDWDGTVTSTGLIAKSIDLQSGKISGSLSFGTNNYINSDGRIYFGGSSIYLNNGLITINNRLQVVGGSDTALLTPSIGTSNIVAHGGTLITFDDNVTFSKGVNFNGGNNSTVFANNVTFSKTVTFNGGISGIKAMSLYKDASGAVYTEAGKGAYLGTFYYY